jgi:peptidoglycan/xylan/chitin deacetylase (PgdA/CDA1 family)
MSSSTPAAVPGPPRDFVGYGEQPPSFRWPDGSSVAVNIVVNVEEGAEYSLLDGDPINDTWGEYSSVVDPSIRDLGTETHMEFGSRVGIWRLARLFDHYGIPATFGVCALALERNPPFAAWLRGQDHDVIGHGYRWSEDSQIERDEERRLLHMAVESIERTTGQRIRGWYVRSFASVNTRDLLVEEGGFLYDSDPANDEVPYFVEHSGKPWLVVPYSKVYNDVKYLVQPTYASPRHFFETVKLGVDYMVEEAERGYGGRMITIGLHPRWSGQAHRTSALRDIVEYVLAKDGACFMRRGDIAQFWLDNAGFRS